MSSSERVERVIDSLRTSFEGTPYFIDFNNHEGKPETKDDLLLSVIIPARNEFPNIVHTFHSIMHCWEADGFDPKQIEIIIVNNGSEDWNQEKYDWSKPGDRGTIAHLLPRGAYAQGLIRVLYDPICGNHSARNKGARIARGKYLFFSDAHMAYKPGTFKYGLQAVDESNGLVHCGINWMGAYAPTYEDGRTGLQYTIKLGEEWKGTWNSYRPWSDRWFYIPAQGHCSVFALRTQFLEFGGYPDVHRTYGGGEFYINMKWWMFGSSVVAEPRAVGYHLSSGRGYTWHHDDYIHNVLNCAYAIGADDWRERTYINYLRRGKREVLDTMMAEGEKEMAKDREFIASRRVITFNEALVQKPWDEGNMKRGGAKNSSMLIFHDTWLPLLNDSPVAKRAYENSKYQADLEKFINENLGDFVYKRVKDKGGETDIEV
jgi:glycosyltransferase involved in cell wall biosynthesis